MQCPKCTNVDMVIVERQGLEVDYCPQCRGVWLDRGELDKLIERSSTESSAGATHNAPSSHHEHPHDYREYGYREHHKHSHYGHHRRKSLLERIFDFD